MVVYNVFSHCAHYNYKTYLCSKATIVLIITTILSVLFPLIFTYRTHGFWLRTDIYQEQPEVYFKYDFILLANTVKQDKLVMCSNLPYLSAISKSHNYCPLVKGREEDTNRDGLNDFLKLGLQVVLPDEDKVVGITLLLLFDYKLSSLCRVQMEALGVVQAGSVAGAGAGAGLSVVADLGLVLRRPLNPRLRDSRYNTSVIPSASAFSLDEVLLQYALRNISTQLTNVYTTWQTHRAVGDPFTIDVTILYPEVTVRYLPSPWQVVKFGWVQFFPILVISIFVFRAVKKFIFGNQLVYTYREEPWKKSF